MTINLREAASGDSRQDVYRFGVTCEATITRRLILVMLIHHLWNGCTSTNELDIETKNYNKRALQL